MRFPLAFWLLASRGFEFAFPNAVGSALDQGDVGMMGEAVEQSGNGGGVGEDRVPVFEALIGSQQDGIAFVTVVDDFKEQVGGVRVIGQVANLVNTEKGGTGVEAELAAAQAWGIAIEIGEQVAGGAEQDGGAGEHGGGGDTLGDHGLAQSVGAAQDEVAALGEEVQGEGGFDQGAVEFLGLVPFEVSHGFEAAETGLSEGGWG